jgi:hypothetical protein
VDFEIFHLAADFTYKAELFDARVMCTRSGRVMGNAAARSLRSRRLLGFLTRHAKLLQRVDVRQAPTLAVLCLRTCFLLELCLLFIYYSVFSSSFCSVI